MASYIVNDKWHEEKQKNMDDESERIAVAAAKLIKSAVRETECDLNTYPNCQTFSEIEEARLWILSLLYKFISNLVSADIKISLGHAIVQAAKPKTVIAPVLFGLGTSLDHLIGSTGKMLINLFLDLAPAHRMIKLRDLSNQLSSAKTTCLFPVDRIHLHSFRQTMSTIMSVPLTDLTLSMAWEL